MDQTSHYGQMDFNLPHDVVSLPSKGLFYPNKKSSLKVGFLTASDENILMSQNNTKDGIIYTLLKNKIYEPNFNIDMLLDVDLQAILIFLRNTAFGSDYTYNLIDPKTNQKFEATVIMDELIYNDPVHRPDENGLFTTTLPKSNKKIKLKLLNWGELREIDRIVETYPKGMVAPTVTKKLEMHIVEVDNITSKDQISSFIKQMPIADSKYIRNFITECEPSIDTKKEVIAPSGEKVAVNVSFGVDFFRPFFTV
jgi:hypothetical protein